MAGDGRFPHSPGRRPRGGWLLPVLALAVLAGGALFSLPSCGGSDLVIPGSAPVVTPSDGGDQGNGSDGGDGGQDGGSGSGG